MKFTKRSQQGFALILVLLIGALMMIPVLMLLSAVAPRRATVTGEAVSDIALASADGVVDKIATQINRFPSLLNNDLTITTNLGSITDSTSMAKFAVGYLLSAYLNGGDYSTTNDYITNLPNIQKAVSTYLYDTRTQKYYAVWSSNRIKSVGSVGPTGDIAGTLTSIQDLSSNFKVSSRGIGGIDSYWLTDNRWIEIDTNTQFDNANTNDDATSRFIIRATAYPLSGNKDISGRMRTVQAEVFLGHVKVVPGGFVDSLWSGGNLEINSGGTMTGNIYSAGSLKFDSGGTINGDVQAGGALLLNSGPVINGNVYAGGSISVPSGCKITGNIQTGGSVTFNTASSSMVGGYIKATNSITISGGANLSGGLGNGTYPLGDHNVSMSTGVSYSAPAVPAMPNFDFAGNFNTAQSTASPYASLKVGGTLAYYTTGSVSSTSNVTLNLPPVAVAGSTVAWYVGGGVDISGDVTLNFTSPCTIFVGGTFHCNNLTIKGHGTIVADTVDVDTISASDTGSNITMIMRTSGVTTFSNPVNIPAIIWAPNGSVTLSSGGTINAGYIVAKGDVNAPSWTNIALPFPGAGSSVSFTFKIDSSTAFKRSWKELISGKYTVTPYNIGNNFPVPQVNGIFSQ